MSREITLVTLLVCLQLAIFRVTQHVFSELYFTTSGILDKREDVRLKAILFRLAIPTAAGASVPLLVDHHEYLIASLSGAIAWLLIMWPALWLPGLLPRAHRGLVLLFLFVFWAAFAAMPVLGALLTMWVQDVISTEDIGWSELLVGAVITLPIGLLPAIVGRFAASRVSFPLDDEPDPDYGGGETDLTDEELLALQEEEFQRSDSERALDFLEVLLRRITWQNVFVVAVLAWVGSRAFGRR